MAFGAALGGAGEPLVGLAMINIHAGRTSDTEQRDREVVGAGVVKAGEGWNGKARLCRLGAFEVEVSGKGVEVYLFCKDLVDYAVQTQVTALLMPPKALASNAYRALM
jgi:hypothetical protein